MALIDDPSRRFLSEEDLDLAALPAAEFARLSAAALRAAQASNELDRHCYSNGCIVVEPGYEHLLPQIRAGVL